MSIVHLRLGNGFLPTGELADAWRAMPQSRVLTAEDAIWSLCPNCMNIAAEWRGAEAHALWELIDADAVICYCHYCLEGLRVGASRSYHIADLIFGNVDAMKKGCCTRFSYSSPH